MSPRFVFRFVVGCLLLSTSSLSAEAPRHVLVIGIDGCRPDALATARTPHLDRLIREGIYFDGTDIRDPDATDKADTISGPGWSNIFTGVWPDKHGVLDNRFTAPNYDRYPHFFSRLRQTHPNAVTASFSTWKPVSEVIVRDATVNEHYPKEGNDYELGDAQAAAACATLIRDEAPDAVALYLGQVDETGHRHGFHPSVAEYIAAIERVDEHIGEVLAAIDHNRASATEWLVLVCTDHGGQGTGHGGGHRDPEVRRTFLIVSGNGAAQGRSEKPTYQVDVVATALTYLNVPRNDDWELDGRAVGLVTENDD